MTVPAPYRGWPAAGPGRLPSGLFFWPECSQRSPESSGTSRDVRRPGLSTCAGCPAGTVALGAGGADTYTQRVIPDLTSSVSVQGSYLVGCHDLVTGDSGDEPGRVVVRSRCCHFCCHRPAGRRWTIRRAARPNRISSSGRHGSAPFMLDQRTRSVRRVRRRTALDCNPNCNRQICSPPWLPADDSVTPWSSSPPPDLFLGVYRCELVGRTGFEPVTSSVSGKFTRILTWFLASVSIDLAADMWLDVSGCG